MILEPDRPYSFSIDACQVCLVTNSAALQNMAYRLAKGGLSRCVSRPFTRQKTAYRKSAETTCRQALPQAAFREHHLSDTTTSDAMVATRLTQLIHEDVLLLMLLAMTLALVGFT